MRNRIKPQHEEEHLSMKMQNGAKPHPINMKDPPVWLVRGKSEMRKPTAKQQEYWDERLTRMKCSVTTGTHPRWLKYAHEVGALFLAAVAEYEDPASSAGFYGNGPKLPDWMSDETAEC
jgi:hypothetical protein